MIKITDTKAIKENKHYQKYYKQKQKILSKYPDTSEGTYLPLNPVLETNSIPHYT